MYVREIEKLTTDSVTNQAYGKMIYEYARDLNARIAINSDYFTTNAINEGLIIRNGMLLQSKQCKNSDLCVVYQDGTVRCFDCKKEKIDNDAIIASYPYHSFYFGPSLLDENGNAKEKFNSTVGGENPRFLRVKTVRPPKNKAAPKAARKLSVMIDFFEWADGKAVDITKKQAETKE